MDKEGWLKTKKGRRVYDKPPKPFSADRILKISNSIKDDLDTLQLFDFIAELFERIIVDRFRNLPFVYEAWETIRDYTRLEHQRGRPMTFPEQLNFILDRFRTLSIMRNEGQNYDHALKEIAENLSEKTIQKKFKIIEEKE
jgi:hypothetical protein